MFLFAKQGKNREGGPGRNFRQEIDVGQIFLCVASGFEPLSNNEGTPFSAAVSSRATYPGKEKALGAHVAQSGR